jgi:hypothetical protein
MQMDLAQLFKRSLNKPMRTPRVTALIVKEEHPSPATVEWISCSQAAAYEPEQIRGLLCCCHEQIDTNAAMLSPRSKRRLLRPRHSKTVGIGAKQGRPLFAAGAAFEPLRSNE